MIYFLQGEGGGNIKIGYTGKDDALQRLADQQVGSPVKLRLLGTIPGSMQDEKDLQRRFNSALSHGEWFRPVPELLALIEPQNALRCESTEVVTQSVQIRVLTVGRKQFSDKLLQQLPPGYFFDLWDVLEELHGDPDAAKKWSQIDISGFERGKFWGWVQTAIGRYLIFERDGVLHKQKIERPNEGNPESDDFPNDWGQFGGKEAVMGVWMKFVSKWLGKENQLFIGV